MLLNNKNGVSRLQDVDKFLRTHARVESVEELSSMFHVQRVYGDEYISPEIALNYLEYAGCLDIDTKKPLVLLTYHVAQMDVYISICNKFPVDKTVLAVCFNSVGQKIAFPAAECEGMFSILNLKHLAKVFDLEEMKQMSGISYESVGKILYTMHLNESRLEYESMKKSQ